MSHFWNPKYKIAKWNFTHALVQWCRAKCLLLHKFFYLNTIAVLAANNKPFFLAILGTIFHQDLVWDYPKIGDFKFGKNRSINQSIMDIQCLLIFQNSKVVTILALSITNIVFNQFYKQIKSMLLRIKCVSQHQHLTLFVVKLSKYEHFFI